MKPKHQRLVYIFVTLGVLAVALTLVLQALREEIVFFYSPSEIEALPDAAKSRSMRLGGLVVKGSLKRKDNSQIFALTDGAKEMNVVFDGVLPALFREGQGIVAEGKLQEDGSFVARTVLAKHDENYMPPEVAKKLKDQGYWKDSAP